MVLVDDAEILFDAPNAPILERIIVTGRDADHGLILAGTTGDLSRCYTGFVPAALKSRCGLLVTVDTPDDGDLFGVRLPRNAAPGPLGRGLIFRSGRVDPIQLAIEESSEEAVSQVLGYFGRNAMARLAMAYYYQEFILGLAAPQTVPMLNVVIALDLSGEGAVSDYKKLLQGFIWKERGHARDLADFLLANGLLTSADVDEARQVAAENERNGVCAMARQRLQYRPKGS